MVLDWGRLQIGTTNSKGNNSPKTTNTNTLSVTHSRAISSDNTSNNATADALTTIGRVDFGGFSPGGGGGGKSLRKQEYKRRSEGDLGGI